MSIGRAWLGISSGLLLLLGSSASSAETAYVTDTVTVAVFPNANLTGEPVERLLSGSKVEVLLSSEGIAEVETPNGKSGWMRTDFLTSELPAVIKLEGAESALEQVNGRLDAAQDEIAKLKRQQAVLQREAEAAKDVGWLKAELAKVRDRASNLEQQLTSQRAEATEVDEQADDLQQRLGTLAAENQDLRQRLAAAVMIEEAAPQAAPAPAVVISERPLPWAVLTLVLGLLVGFAAGYYWIDRRLRRRFCGVRVY